MGRFPGAVCLEGEGDEALLLLGDFGHDRGHVASEHLAHHAGVHVADVGPAVLLLGSKKGSAKKGSSEKGVQRKSSEKGVRKRGQSPF
jgi:hypothetical protein